MLLIGTRTILIYRNYEVYEGQSAREETLFKGFPLSRFLFITTSRNTA